MAMVTLIAWTFLCLISLFANLRMVREQAFQEVRTIAENTHYLDLVYRKWNASLGGVYALASPVTQPNPFLPESVSKSLETVDGRTLVLINPALMTRKVNELRRNDTHIRGRLTSLQPFNPANAPDEWERKALKSFEAGAKVAEEQVIEDGERVLRFMRPLYVQQSCMQCHSAGSYDYELGDVRGGLGFSVPFSKLKAKNQESSRNLMAGHGVIWLLGVLGIVLARLIIGKAILRRVKEAEQLELVIEGTDAGTWQWDIATGKTEFNERWAEMIGYTLDELGDTDYNTWQEFTHPEDLSKAEPLLEAVFAQRTPQFACKFRMRHRDGSWRWIWARGRVNQWSADGNPLMMSGTHLDITELEERTHALEVANAHLSQREAQLKVAKDRATELAAIAEKSSKAKSAFLAMMSHEIRTPLNAILGMNQLLSTTEQTDEQIEYTDTIRLGGETLMAVINDVLDYSKIESDRLDLEQKPFQLELTLDKAIKIIQVKAAEKHIRIEPNRDKLEPKLLIGDAARILQILLNLLSNGVKFTPEGGCIQIKSATLRSSIEGKQTIQIQVSDTGPGIPAGREEMIFEPFRQSDNSISREFGGTGLGLSISRRLAQLMGGSLTGENLPEGGACFSLEVQLQSVPDNSRPEGQRSANLPDNLRLDLNRAEPTSSGKASILVVDDSRVNAKVASTLLERQGHQTSVALSAKEAYRLVEAQPFDLILMDIQMPGIDGMKATRQLQETYGAELPPVIGLTALTDPGIRRESLEAGMRMVLSKPIDLEELNHAIGLHLSKAQQPTALEGTSIHLQ